MRLHLEILDHHAELHVHRQAGDPKARGGGWNPGYEGRNSQFLYWIQEALESTGFDLIKKKMWKDGHLVSDDEYYLRARAPKPDIPHVYVHNPHYAYHNAAEEFNEGKWVVLDMVYDVWQTGQDTASMVKELAMAVSGHKIGHRHLLTMKDERRKKCANVHRRSA